MLDGDPMVRADDPALEQREDALDGVGVNIAPYPLRVPRFGTLKRKSWKLTGRPLIIYATDFLNKGKLQGVRLSTPGLPWE